MKYILVALIFFNTESAFAANWLPLGPDKEGKSTYEVDYESINVSNARPSFWIRQVFKTPTSDRLFGPSYSIDQMRYEVECGTGNAWGLARLKLSEEGNVIWSAPSFTQQLAIPPGTNLEVIGNFACFIKKNGLELPDLVMADQWEELKSRLPEAKLFWSEKSAKYRNGLIIHKIKQEFESQPASIKVPASRSIGYQVVDCNALSASAIVMVILDKDGKKTLSFLRGPINFQPMLEENQEKAKTVCSALASKEPVIEGKEATKNPQVDNTKSVAAKSTGSGFFINAEGYVATNNHVINGCRSLRVKLPNKEVANATLIVADAINDLAIIKSATPAGSYAILRDSPARSGEGIIAMGFPFTGLLASEANVSTGNIAATAGLGNDYTKLQISAPVQPGNSGGPLLDGGGSVVGVVVAKLNAIAVFKMTGDIPQNINFAIKSDMLKLLLDSNQIKYSSGSPAKKMDTPDVADKAKQFTVLVECY